MPYKIGLQSVKTHPTGYRSDFLSENVQKLNVTIELEIRVVHSLPFCFRKEKMKYFNTRPIAELVLPMINEIEQVE